MYQTSHGTVTDSEAVEIEKSNRKIWEDFWKIPREQRTNSDWEKLRQIEILARK